MIGHQRKTVQPNNNGGVSHSRNQIPIRVNTMEENEKGGYSAEGRKLRPRRQRISQSSEGRYGSSAQKDYGSGDKGSYGAPEGRSHRVYYHNQEERASYRKDYNSSSDWHGRSQRPSPYGRGGYGGNDSEGRSYQHKGYGNREGGYQHRNAPEGGYERRNTSEGGYQRRSYDSSEGEYRHRNNFNRGDRAKSYGSREGGGYGSPDYHHGRPQRPAPSHGRGSAPYGDRRPYGKGEYGSSEGRKGGYGSSDRKGDYGEKGRFRKGAGSRSAGFQSMYSFDKSSAEGINRMLSRKKVIDESQATGYEGVQVEAQEEIRLNKFIANSGVCSRREADQFILAGVVTVNDEVITELGTKVNVQKDEVKFNGETIKGEKKVYIVMNKPKGYVTTSSDPHAEKTVMDLLKGCTYRVFPVGRLDKSTTGVLMFTNDGDIAEKLTHPSYDKKKIYQVILDNPLTDEHKEQVLAGVTLGDGEVKADELEYIDEQDHRKLGIEIHSGKNRIVRRIFESLGYDVKALDRVYFAGLTKKGLKKGEWRYLTEGEVGLLKMGAYV